MALIKQPVNLNFSQGLNTKADPYQVQIGNFLTLQNSVFDKAGRLTKRNGFANITDLPNDQQTTLTTINGNLLATGNSLYAFSQDTNQWLNQGEIQPVHLNVTPVIRSSANQTTRDSVTASNGLTLVTYRENSLLYYVVIDSVTGQQIVTRTALPSTATNCRTFILGRYFIITFLDTVSAASHLQYIAIPIITPNLPGSLTDLATDAPSLSAGYDGYIANDTLYIAYAGTGTTIKIKYMSSTLVQSATTSIAAHTATLMSVTADITAATAVIWVTFYDVNTGDGYAIAYNQSLNPVPVTPLTQVFNDGGLTKQITSVAQNQLLTIIAERSNTYSFSPNAQTDLVRRITVTQTTAIVTGPTNILRSVGLASKAFIAPDGTIYALVTFGESPQQTYFLMDSLGNVYMRLAYGNGGGYITNEVLPSVSFVNGIYYVTYLFKDFLAAVNKGTALPSGTPTGGLYTQTGVNLAKFTINSTGQYSSEIANALHLTGGQLWEYDGVKPVEHGFQVWPNGIGRTGATTGGSIADGTYYYAFTYEWTDNQGLLHRSAPSIPLLATISAGTGTVTNTMHVPTLRITYKVAPNEVRVVGYRWSAAQPVYYQFTSVTTPVLNDTTVDSVDLVDTFSDAEILGNTILYTTGGVVENIAAPASTVSCLYKNRLFLVDAEDQNLLWFSKQVIEAVPVEMSDLFTIYVAPTSGAQGSTGFITALSAMDDKLIVFKRDAIYYVTGNGPDNTGANNDFSDPIFITSSVGCANPNSIVLMQNGLMFQSDKGIWILGRDLNTSYIGAPVEQFNSNVVQSAQSIPATNQVRFILDNGMTLMYDYFYSQWGTFTNISAVSGTLYQGAHTYLNRFGEVLQETPGTYVDGSKPVLMSFTTSWINVAGLQGYERFYHMFLLGTYYTPFNLYVNIAYDYNTGPSQSIQISPDNATPSYGGEALWGNGQPWGGVGNVFEARMFPDKQKCESFQLFISEVYDSSLGVPSGQGLTLSGLNMIVGVKKGSRTSKASRNFGG